MEPENLVVSANRDPDSIREFFNGWALYRRIVDHDYLCHQSTKQALGEWLDRFGQPFSFLDLGCGDAAFSAGVLTGRTLTSYTGVDISPVALDLAAQNTRQIKAPCSLKVGDFLTEISALQEVYDIIYIGLSLHHLRHSEKETFLGKLRRRLAPGGVLVVYDPVLSPGETRDAYMSRWVDDAQRNWRALSIEDIAEAVKHVTTSDFPEEIGTLDSMALSSGFQRSEILFTDPDQFYALMAFRGE
jgi:SAM-dependent methyltransferase